MIRLFVHADLKAGAAVAPGMEASRYLIAVMRLTVGSEVLLFNGRDGEWRATVVDPDKRRCRLTVGSRVRTQETGPDLTLIMALVKRGPLEMVIEKAAELGAARVQLVQTRRTNADKANVERLVAIATEAAEQTGRLDVPDILAPVKLSKLLEGWDASRRLMFCDETGGAPVLEALEGAEAGPWAILIGPEGGFDPEEADQLRAMDCATVVSLGPRILRADTAAIGAMTLWQAAIGDWAQSSSG